MKHALLLCWVTTVCSYRTGAPGSDIVCRAMFPVGHGHEAQTGPAPYTISVSTTVFFDAYDKVQGTLNWYVNDHVYYTLENTYRRMFT